MAQLPTGITLDKIPITTIIMIFVTYLVVHIVIAVMLKKKKEELENMTIDTPGYYELANIVKWTGSLYKWFPAIIVVLILIGFYL